MEKSHPFILGRRGEAQGEVEEVDKISGKLSEDSQMII